MVAAGSAAKELWALDFDGVTCDSVGESSLSAFKAAAKLWPEVFQTPEAEARKEELVEKMRVVRPVVETGYENIVQIRCLLEGVDPTDMLQRWHDMLPEYMQRWQLDRVELVHLFGSTRDEWMAADLEGWLAPNRIYPGVAEAVRALMQQHEVYIVTTKQARFTEAILRQMAGISFPPDRIFSQTVSGQPKSEVLEMLAARHPHAPSLHFVEDKMSTLEKVAKLPSLEQYHLYLVDWGYNTQQERRRAAANERIAVVDIQQFMRLAGAAESATA
ncbi:hypothetical protein CHLNCDRAFT_24112 [Chlorella variabilis]|uniref:Uncharacterized protein n=1 Tax=Chlorella variabilis TaxID=554065 RepID=E1ZHC7_CHLVA|nr:hypothetical protein CHLNCDRAFT_24112 [Chlorella variabilis]EFN54892.1 hypothetical protein CHLNCDRAFT_24112 [Chlorella variabilis]|eukprot:XP_005846994.1 hypothetical protein CHLNCDRAFT_24112 [Chlorella variabilis]